MVMLSVMWLMTAMVVGFMLGRVSMYGQTGVLEAVEDMEEGYSVEKKHSMEKEHSTDKYVSPLSERYASRQMQYIFSQDMKFPTWRRL